MKHLCILNKMPKILIIDDEALQREMLAGFLTKQGYDTRIASGGREGLEIYSQFFAPLVITDMKMPDMDGMEVLVRLREINPFVQVIVLTAYGTVETAVESMRQGALGYLTKPINLDELLINLKKALEQNRLVVENDFLQRTINDLAQIPEMIGESDQIKKLRSLLSRVGPSNVSVLITGPSGTGKGLAAQIVHRLSDRRDKRFVSLNCASLPESLLESELFGHEKGAFTGADKKRLGRFELADGGTIFLDEIGDMPLAMQAKLLRVLEDGSFEPLGSEKTKKVDVRVISATNRDINELIEEGKFRQDLNYRINTVTIEMPQLKDRGGDILLLARQFLDKTIEKMNKKIDGISEEAAARLISYSWPGNVRELQNVIERAAVLTIEEVIGPDDLPGLGPEMDSVRPVRNMSLMEIEKEHIEQVLKAKSGNMQKTANILGIHRNTLRQKIKDYQIKS